MKPGSFCDSGAPADTAWGSGDELYLGYPCNSSERVHKPLSPCDVIPCDGLPVHDKLLSCIKPAHKAYVEAQAQLHEVECACTSKQQLHVAGWRC